MVPRWEKQKSMDENFTFEMTSVDDVRLSLDQLYDGATL